MLAPVDAGPFVLDAAVESITDGPMKAFDLGFGEGVGAAERVDFGGKEAFVRIDIADTRDKGLFEQQRLNLAVPPVQTLGQYGRGEVVFKRFRAEIWRNLGNVMDIEHAPEATRIGEVERLSVRQTK